MILIFHIAVALSGIVFSTLSAFSPSQKKIYITYGLVGLTFITGGYLVIAKPGHLVQSCVMGLIYLGVALSGVLTAHYRLSIRTSN